MPRDPATGFGRSATTVPKKGQPDPPSKTETVAQVAKSTAVGLKSILMWVVPIAAAVIALYFIFLGDKAPAEVRTPDATIMTYTETVQMYVPPAGRMPSQDGVSTWLNFFDGPSRLWFNENVDKLAFIMNQDKPEEFMDWPDTKKRSEAMKFLLTQPPLGGVVKVISVYNDEDNGTAQVEVRAGLGQASFSMVEKDDRWQFQDMMGKKIQIGQIIAPLNPPKRNR
ncbi:hypothetical protein KQI84_02095 [bacterium]|nr:hypothetical protein [bacterium]